MSDTAATKTDLDSLFRKPLLVANSMNPDSFTPGTLFHYTGAAGVKGILLDKSLWATNFSFLNDPSEVQYGRKLILDTITELDSDIRKRIVERIEKHALSEVYVSCFTECRDDLSQWRAYGTPAAARYCIGFDRQAIEEWAEVMPEVHFEKVIYMKRKQQQEVRWLCDQALTGIKHYPSDAENIADLVADHLARLLPLLKDPAYTAEEEWRIIRWIPNASDVSEVCFDVGRGVVRPYVEFLFANKEPLPVVELLVLAPGRDRTAVEKATDMLLRKADIVNVRSEHSQVPFAEWL